MESPNIPHDVSSSTEESQTPQLPFSNTSNHEQKQLDMLPKNTAPESNLSTTILPPKDEQTNLPSSNTNTQLAVHDIPSLPDQNVAAASQPIPFQPTTVISHGGHNATLPEAYEMTLHSDTEITPKQDTQQSQQTTPQKVVVTKVKLSDELNLFDWFNTKGIINHIAEKAKNSVESVVTALDPGMREYLYSGGSINIMVITDSESLVSPIRDAFQTVFGRATVVAARYNPPTSISEHPIKLASGFNESITVAQERIRNLRMDTSNVPQNQVVIAVLPSLVRAVDNTTACSQVTNGLKLDNNLLPEWFLTYSMVIEDPVLGATMSCFSQFIPIDSDIITAVQEAKLPDESPSSNLGFPTPINELMATKLKLTTDTSASQGNNWLHLWSGLSEEQIINDLSISLAHLYRRKWNDCVS